MPSAATGHGLGNYKITYVDGTLTVGASIIVLDPTASGVADRLPNATVNVTGGVFVDSSSSTALTAKGSASIKASVIDVHGGVKIGGTATLSPAPVTGAAILADPLSGVAEPSTAGLTNDGSLSLSGKSHVTINPGIYSEITVSGNAVLTMNPGVYIIEGGGFSVSNKGVVSGTGVTIFNAGSNYPSTGGQFGTISLGGTAR